MKCAACGYEKRSKTYKTDKVIRFKSGKRKGEVKSVESEIIDPDGCKDNFIAIHPLRIEESFVRNRQYCGEIEGCVYACPECGTLKLEL